MTTPWFILISTRGGVNLIVEGDLSCRDGSGDGSGTVRRWWDATEWAVISATKPDDGACALRRGVKIADIFPTP